MVSTQTAKFNSLSNFPAIQYSVVLLLCVVQEATGSAHLKFTVSGQSKQPNKPTNINTRVQCNHASVGLSSAQLCDTFHSPLIVPPPQGRTQRLKKGGLRHRYKVGLVRPCGARSAPNFFRERIMHSVLGRSGGMLLYEFRRYESASEAVGDHHNHTKCLTTGL